MKLLVRFFWDCGRQGDVEGLFITDQKQLDSIYGKEVYFGEILGKHSEVFSTVDKEDIGIICDDQEVIGVLQKAINGDTLSGYNPFDYLDE